MYGTSYGPNTYDWRKETIRSYEYLTAGSRIDFQYDSDYWSTSGEIEWEGKNFRIYQLTEDIGLETYPIYFDYPGNRNRLDTFRGRCLPSIDKS